MKSEGTTKSKATVPNNILAGHTQVDLDLLGQSGSCKRLFSVSRSRGDRRRARVSSQPLRIVLFPCRFFLFSNGKITTGNLFLSPRRPSWEAKDAFLVANRSGRPCCVKALFRRRFPARWALPEGSAPPGFPPMFSLLPSRFVG